jgi:hypothetical protein
MIDYSTYSRYGYIAIYAYASGGIWAEAWKKPVTTLSYNNSTHL